jgi:hypothetical protein
MGIGEGKERRGRAGHRGKGGGEGGAEKYYYFFFSNVGSYICSWHVKMTP